LPTQFQSLNSGLTVTFLGTGTSQGVPMIGCDCESAVAPIRATNGCAPRIYVKPGMLVCGGHWDRFQNPGAPRKYPQSRCGHFHASHTDHSWASMILGVFSHARGSMRLCIGRERCEVWSACFRSRSNEPSGSIYLKPEPHVIGGPFCRVDADHSFAVPHGTAS